MEAIEVCDNSPIVHQDSAGINDLNSSTQGCLLGGESRATWIKAQVSMDNLCESLLVFSIISNGEPIDFDFAVYKTTNCDSLGAPIRCSYFGKKLDTIGLSKRSGHL